MQTTVAAYSARNASVQCCWLGSVWCACDVALTNCTSKVWRPLRCNALVLHEHPAPIHKAILKQLQQHIVRQTSSIDRVSHISQHLSQLSMHHLAVSYQVETSSIAHRCTRHEIQHPCNVACEHASQPVIMLNLARRCPACDAPLIAHSKSSNNIPARPFSACLGHTVSLRRHNAFLVARVHSLDS